MEPRLSSQAGVAMWLPCLLLAHAYAAFFILKSLARISPALWHRIKSHFGCCIPGEADAAASEAWYAAQRARPAAALLCSARCPVAASAPCRCTPRTALNPRPAPCAPQAPPSAPRRRSRRCRCRARRRAARWLSSCCSSGERCSCFVKKFHHQGSALRSPSYCIPAPCVLLRLHAPVACACACAGSIAESKVCTQNTHAPRDGVGCAYNSPVGVTTVLEVRRGGCSWQQ